MDVLFCDNCKKNQHFIVIDKKETFTIMNEQITIDTQVATCSSCNNELFYEPLDSQTILKAYNQYREKHGLLMPNEVKYIREMYGLDQEAFSRITGIDIISIERGSVQTEVEDRLLVLLNDVRVMQLFIQEYDHKIDPKDKKILNLKLKKCK